jgi:peptidoglycan hydrolase-like amidase
VYQKSVRCWREADGSGRTPLDLSSESAAAAYWGATPSQRAFCSGAGLNYRWSFTVTRADKEKVLDEALDSATSVSPAYTRGKLGTLRDMVVLSRASSGKIGKLQIVGTGGTWTITGDGDIRLALSSTPPADGQTLSAARSATAVFTISRDTGGNVTSVNTRGGGFGHGWGMCQNGAIGMAKAGYAYDVILRHYYSGVEVTTISSGSPVPPATGPRLFLPLGPRRGSA